MKIRDLTSWALAASVAVAAVAAGPASATGLTEGSPKILSMSGLAFGPEGVLFIGDGKGGAVFAVDVGDAKPGEATEPVAIQDLERVIAALLGTTPAEVMIHDLAVNPLSKKVYLAVSRGRGQWDTEFKLPNDVADATILLRVEPDGRIEEVPLDMVPFARAALTNPIDPEKTHRWKKGVSLRTDTITDMALSNGTLYVAGLSNEEFASTLWKVPFPFADGVTATTLEIYHGAHGAYETHAPIRTFVPYSLAGESHLLAAYLCTPLVTFREDQLAGGAHVKGRTVAEFGSGNYPLDMVVYEKNGKERLLIANSNLPFMVVDPADIESFEGEIAAKVDTYLAGVAYEPRAGTGIQQLDRFSSSHLVGIQRLPSGRLDLVSLPVGWF